MFFPSSAIKEDKHNKEKTMILFINFMDYPNFRDACFLS